MQQTRAVLPFSTENLTVAGVVHPIHPALEVEAMGGRRREEEVEEVEAVELNELLPGRAVDNLQERHEYSVATGTR